MNQVQKTKVLVIGNVSWNTMIDLDKFPAPIPNTIFSSGFRDTLGGSGAGKALNLARLGFDVMLYAPLGDDERGQKVEQALKGIHFTHEPVSYTHLTLPTIYSV